MDKSTKKQRYSLRKTQMGVGSVLLATVLLTAGTTRANSVVGQPNESLTDPIQGRGGPNIMSLNQDGGDHQKQGPGLGLGLNNDGSTRISSLAGPSGSGHEGKVLGQGLSDGNADITSGNGTQGEPKLHVPGETRTPAPDKKPEVDQETPEETPKPQPQTQPKPAPKSEATPKTESRPKTSETNEKNHKYLLVYQEGLSSKVSPEDKTSSRIGKELGREGYDDPNEKDGKLEAAKKKYASQGYNPDYDKFEYGDTTLLVFHRFKTYIVLETIGDDGKVESKQTSVFYGDKRQEDVKKRVNDLTEELGKIYDVERSEFEDKEKREKTITLKLKPKKSDMPKVPEVPKNPEKPSTPEVAPKPDDKPSVPSKPEVAPKPDAKPSVPSKPEVAPKPDAKPSVPSKPEVAPKPGDKPSVPSIPEMVPEPEKLEMDKSMKVVPGKPKKATPEAQVPEAQVPQVQVPQSQAPQLPSPKEEVAKVQQQPRAIQSSAPAKSGGKQLPNTGEAASILTLVGSGMLGLLGLAFTKKRKTK
ncbi:LPXTG cell wall anchor domain-containing protein [Streptococcus ruminantium]|uniref:LPXTG cell wall anchor domain-containing protein n=1 Tax=Streptococcus ruminantium TaxID=1917441 RepID=UPI001F016253|nr:LPXTG cell wall anchor domain-containing protein [Streptococcus ruminantium]BDD41856.1 hypothetical protein GUT189_01890 [Streptococcus ruminantium]